MSTVHNIDGCEIGKYGKGNTPDNNTQQESGKAKKHLFKYNINHIN